MHLDEGGYWGVVVAQVDYDAAARHAPALRHALLAAAAAAGPGLGRLWGVQSGAAGGGGGAEVGEGGDGRGRRGAKRRAGAEGAAEDAGRATGAGWQEREGWLQCQNKGCRRWARPPPNLSTRPAAIPTALGSAPARTCVAGGAGLAGCSSAPADADPGPCAAGDGPAAGGALAGFGSGGAGPFYCRRRCAMEAQAFEGD